MSLPRSRSETEIINHRTDNGDYGLVMKSNNEDKPFQARPVKVSLFGPPVGIFSGPATPSGEIGYMLKMDETRSPSQDVVSDFGIYHPEIRSKPKSPTVSRPAPPSEEFGFKMDETRSPSQDVLSKWKSGTVNDMTCLGIFPVPGQKPRHCGACGGEHDFWFCPLRWTCKFDQEVGEDYEIVCLCSTPLCCGQCSPLLGRVRMKKRVSNFDVQDPLQIPRWKGANEEDG
ncbi:hypothetical protein CASFOL_008282 [Castilleja foliolosa]|uniref:Uncharacterized protein n=1 Tax=Castilleja foliolosa TaxID=1961234 RepID=A0ABD3E2J8_9LAMI